MRAVPKVAVAWFALVGSFLLALAIVYGGKSVSDAPEDFIARGFHDLFQTAIVVGGGLDLAAAVLTWKGWRWFGLLVALLGLAISALLVAAVGFIALALVAGYVVSIASLMGPRPARG